MAIALVLIFWIFWKIRHRYIVPSREIKRFDGITRSPVYAMLSEDIKGHPTIRAHGIEMDFQRRFEQALDLNGSWWTAFLLTSRWLGVRLDGIVALVMLLSVAFTLILSDEVLHLCDHQPDTVKHSVGVV